MPNSQCKAKKTRTTTTVHIYYVENNNNMKFTRKNMIS